MSFHSSSKTLVFAAILAVFGLTAPAHAQDNAMDAPQGLMPAGQAVDVDSQFAYGEETHPPLRLTPDKSEILNLNEDVERVIIGNDTHLNILMDTSRRLILVPRVPGATFFTLLGANGKILMQRHAIIASPAEKYVRVRQPCVDGNCQPVKMYYCPDMCHEVGIVGKDGATLSGTIGQTPDMSGSSSSSSDATSTTDNATGTDSTSESNTSSEGQ